MTTPSTAQEQLDFLHELLRATQAADITGDLLWHSDGQRIQVWANVSDVFAWGSADAEEITPGNLPVLKQAIADLRAIHRFDEVYAPELFAARVRGQRPQGAAYPKERAATQALFDACGPARERGFGNPRRVPVPEDWQQAQLNRDHTDLGEQAAELRARHSNEHNDS